MGTRGLYGIRKNGIDKCTYNHFDSYPGYLGNNILEFCCNDIDYLTKFFEAVELVNENELPIENQINQCINLGLYDDSVSTGSVNEWYCLLRNLQGNFKLYQELVNCKQQIYMIDNIEFIKDSLFCEYAYIINLDDLVLEYYRGFQKNPQKENRYGTVKNEDGYYPCKLVFTIPLDDISKNNIDTLVKDMQIGFRFENEYERDQFYSIKELFDLEIEDVLYLINHRVVKDEIAAIYDSKHDVGYSYVDGFLNNDLKWLNNDRYINYENIGEFIVEYRDSWVQLPSKKYVLLN